MRNIADIIGLTEKIGRPRTKAFIKRYCQDIPKDADVIDIGCGNAEFQEFLPNIKTLEMNPRGKVDYVGNVEDMRNIIPNDSFDVVIFSEVLEHVEHPKKAVDEIHRILRPNGLLLFSTPFIFPLHDMPIDHWRFTENGIRLLFSKFEVVDIEEKTNTMETLAALYQRIGFQCDTLKLRPFKVFWFLLAKVTMLFSGILTKQYGDIGHTVEVPNILVSGYNCAFRK